MAITTKDQQELDQIFVDLGNIYNGDKNDYFAFLYLKKKFKCNAKEIAHQIAFGNKDYGIDAYYIDLEAKNLYIYQFKWSENHNLFKESFDRLTNDGIPRVFGNPYQDPEQNEVVKHLKADLFQNKERIDRVYIQYVFKGDVDAAEKSEGLSVRKESLEDKDWIIKNYFDRQVPLIVDYVSDKRSSNPPKVADVHRILFNERITKHIPSENKVMHIGFIRLLDLYKISQNLGNKFLNRNIRNVLSPENPPNKKIREALYKTVIKKESSPEAFTFNHNGITLAAEHIEFGTNEVTIKVPRLLNGAQTVSSFAHFIEENEKNPALKANQNIIEAINVVAKIVVDEPTSDFVTNVTICNNRQNPVEPWNLRANDKIQCDLQDKFIEDLGIWYSRQENDFDKLTDAERDEMGVTESKNIKIKPLAQTFLAIQGEMDKFSRLPEVFENNKIYNDTFKESYIYADTSKIVIAYKTFLCLNSPMSRLYELSSIKLGNVIGKSRNLIFALLIQAIFNDTKVKDLLEWYGNTLNKEADFREYLQRLASSKILPIIKEVITVKEYQIKIEKEKYGFLRTKEMYRRCMDIAYEKFKWTKKSV